MSIRNGDREDIWILDRAAGTFTRLTTEGLNGAPEWTADGRRVLYKTVRTGGVDDGPTGTIRIMWQRIDGSAPAEVLFETEPALNEAVLSADERWLVVRTAPGGKTPRDIFAVDLKGDRALRPLATGPTSEIMPRLSPDGRWLAYQSDQGGRAEIYVRPFLGDGARVQVSNEGGSEPLWDASGRTLYYRAPGASRRLHCHPVLRSAPRSRWARVGSCSPAARPPIPRIRRTTCRPTANSFSCCAPRAVRPRPS